jgi:hypothetical protein
LGRPLRALGRTFKGLGKTIQDFRRRGEAAHLLFHHRINHLLKEIE